MRQKTRNRPLSFNIVEDVAENKNYYGVTRFVGIAPPPPTVASVEVHTEWGETGTAFQFNVFDIMQNIYIKIMEW